MEIYNQMNAEREQMMLFQAMQLQQQAYMYSLYAQPAQQTYCPPADEKKNNKRSYVQCDLWKRQSLVEKVEKDGMTIKDAAKLLEINYSTAKHIVKVFRQTGEVETKVMMKKKTKDSSNDVNSDENMEFESYPQMQTPSYGMEMSYSMCQLPVDENMVDDCFTPEELSAEEKHAIHSFFF